MIAAARLAAFAAGAIAVAGYACVFAPLEARLGTRGAELDAARLSVERNLAAAHALPGLEREAQRLSVELHRAHVDDRRTAAVERFLRTLAGVASRNAVTVAAVVPAARPALAPSPGPAVVQTLAELPFDVTLRGAYGDILRALRELSRTGPPLQLTLSSMSSAGSRSASSPQLTAAFHFTLLLESDAA